VAGVGACATAHRTRARGVAEGLTVVKRRKVRGFFCISVVSRNSNMDCGLFCSESRGTFANMSVLTWAPRHGPHPHMGHASRGPRWAGFGYLFRGKIEIAFYFNSELNFGN